jgi:glucose/arabinose dehydrogenase
MVASAVVGIMALASCGDVAKLTLAEGTGPRPTLPEPSASLIPTLHIARATGWPEGTRPTPAAGMQVEAFARGLDHPRWLYVLPNGDVLVAETDAPPKPDDASGLRGWIAGRMMKRAGALAPSANRITLLRPGGGHGGVALRSVLLSGLHSPFGMALVGDTLYVANSNAIMGFPYATGVTTITAPGVKLVDLPAGPINHHWTKNLIASRDGTKLYATVGSNSNVAERGMAVEAGRAAIWEVDIRSQTPRLFATGLRNPNGLAWQPGTGALWTAVNERDELGSDLVPDYMTAVRDGGFYGWPFSYYGQHVDRRVQPQRPDLVTQAIVPDYALGPHTASLGLAWSDGTTLPARFASGMFIGQHGSWNRRPSSGYRVIFVPFTDGAPMDQPLDVLTGFLSEAGDALGRPVGVALDAAGSLLVADDVGNVIWRVSSTEGTEARELPDR